MCIRDRLSGADGWLVPRSDKSFSVRFGGRITENWESGKLSIIHEGYDEVTAVPYDILISGSDCNAVNNLRLWRARSSTNIDMSLFSQGQYERAMQESTNAEVISKVLYPSDEHDEGKLLRLSQQYFLVSASLQCIIDVYKRQRFLTEQLLKMGQWRICHILETEIPILA